MLRIFVLISCILFLAFAVGLIENPNGIQRQIFFRGMDDLFADYFNLLRLIADRDPYFISESMFRGIGMFGGFPLSGLILYPFSQLDNFGTMSLRETWNSKMGLMSVFLFMGFSTFFLFTSLNKIARKFSISPVILISLVLSYIFFISFERGNQLILSAACIGYFICCYDSENKNERILAMVFLAFAATLKIYPVLFGFLYFDKKQYREIFISATITLLLAFVPFLFFKRGFANIPQMVNLVSISTEFFTYKNVVPRFSFAHLVFRISKVIFGGSEEIILPLCSIAGIISGALSFISIIFSCLIKNKWMKISLLTLAVLFLPVNSGLYCGLYLFPMIILFFATMEERSKVFNLFIFIVFILFLNPFQIGWNDQSVPHIINNLAFFFNYQSMANIINMFVLWSNQSLNYIIINVVLLSLWIVLLVESGKQIFLHYKNRWCTSV
jgi:hypothetical protein